MPAKGKGKGKGKEEYKPERPTIKAIYKYTPVGNLPLDVVEQIDLFSRRGRGRPKATPQQKKQSTEKENETKKLRARANRAFDDGRLEEAKATINEMRQKGLLGERSKKLQERLMEFEEKKATQQIMEEENVILDKQAEAIANKAIEDAQKELIEEILAEEIKVNLPQVIDMMPIKETMVLRGAESKTALPPQKQLTEAEMKSFEEIANEYVKTHKMTPNEAIIKAKKMSAAQQFSSNKEALLAKENQLVFGELAKPKSTTTQSDLQQNFVSVDKSKPKEDKPKTNIPYAEMPKQIRNYLRDYLKKKFKIVPDYNETEFVMDNFVDDETKQRLIENVDGRAGAKIGEIIQNARETEKFVSKDIEGNEQMSKEERQILFHKLMIENRSVREDVKKGKTNFDNYDLMSGGVNAGLETKSKKDEESTPIKLPDVFRDYEFLLDSKIKDNAEARELFKGINPNAIIDSGDEELIAAYFAKMNELSNEQDDKEINEAVENIEILSGGNKDTLFGATDLLTTRGNLNVRFNQDLPDNIPDNPAPIERGRDARAIPEVNIDAINRENRADYATTIASGLGVLGSAYRGIFGKNDIPASRGQNDILEDINQNIRLMGKRGIYGDDKSLKIDDELYEGTTLDKRLSSLREFKNQRILGEKNPQMLDQHAEATQDDALRNAMMFNRGGGGAQGASLQQLRQQEFAYKQANRSVAHVGSQFIRGGRGTQIKIEQEYDP
jgi:hypothetical protein